ncbi:hypothetical protein ACJJIF_09345 [Microbulbifer sp. SSSA002]|uniref:hypothetical protein n=1 Tax=Microbulbifer sp. SSSA002 TaxID=3243376 RepID=UPI004039C9D3
MNNSNFQKLVWVSLIWVVVAIAAAFVAPSDLNPILLDQLDRQLDEEWTLFDSFGLGIVLFGLVCNIALLFYKGWARLGYLVLIPASMVITYIDGPFIQSSIDALTNDINLFLSGVLWAVLLFTEIKFKFKAHNNSSKRDAVTGAPS